MSELMRRHGIFLHPKYRIKKYTSAILLVASMSQKVQPNCAAISMRFIQVHGKYDCDSFDTFYLERTEGFRASVRLAIVCSREYRASVRKHA
jgi:hypothetical protein